MKSECEPLEEKHKLKYSVNLSSNKSTVNRSKWCYTSRTPTETARSSAACANELQLHLRKNWCGGRADENGWFTASDSNYIDVM